MSECDTLKELCPYVSPRCYVKYNTMLVACGIGLPKLRVHNWGVDNSFAWYITRAVAAQHCLA